MAASKIKVGDTVKVIAGKDLVSFRLVLESETAEGSEAGNDCVGPEDPFHHLHHAENRNSL